MKNSRMDIAFFTDRRSIPKLSGDSLDGADDVSFRWRSVTSLINLMKGSGGQDGSGPSTKILAGEVLASRFEQIIVHVARGHIAGAAFGVPVLKQILARQFLTSLHDS